MEISQEQGFTQQDAPQEAVDYILKQPVETGDGRSRWVWIRLPDGDLALAVYPQGATYFAIDHWHTI